MATIEVFRNAAARDSQLTAPMIGQACVLLDSGNFLIFYGGIAGWQPPWNTAWGQQGFTLDVNFSQALPIVFGTNIGLSSSFTPVPNRIYQIDFQGAAYSTAVSDTLEFFIVREDANITIVNQVVMQDLTQNVPRIIQLSGIDESGWSIKGATVKYSVYGQSLLAGGVANPGLTPFTTLQVSDIGPSGPPI